MDLCLWGKGVDVVCVCVWRAGGGGWLVCGTARIRVQILLVTTIS